MITNSVCLSFSDAFSMYGDREFLIVQDGRVIRYDEFWEGAVAIASRLHEQGVVAGDRLIVMLENSEHLLCLYLASAMIGAVVCPLDPLMPDVRVAPIKKALAPKLVIDSMVLRELLAPPAVHRNFNSIDEDNDFVIIYSSGTTGEPKGIVHTIRSIVGSACAFAAMSELGESSVVYHHFPMYYMAGIFNMFLCPLVAGSRIVLGPRFSNIQMLRFWENPIKHGVNHLTITPTMANTLCQLYRTDNVLLDHLSRYQAVISTSSFLYPTVASRFIETFGVPLRSCYGVTEVGGSFTLQTWAEALAQDSVGRIYPDTEIRTTGTPEAPGEIYVKTPFLMRGYLIKGIMQPQFDEKGFFATGDLGYVRDGQLFLTGRENDLVKKGGEFISLSLLENLSLRIAGVSEVAAVAVQDEYWGNRVVLFYVAINVDNIKEVEDAINAEYQKCLRKIELPDKLIPVPVMPKTSVGKILKRDLIVRYTI